MMFLSAIMLYHLQLLGLKDGNTLVALQTSDGSCPLENVSSGQFLVVADPAQLAALEVCSLLSFSCISYGFHFFILLA